MVIEKNSVYIQSMEHNLRHVGFKDIITAPNNAVASLILRQIECDIVCLDYDNDNTSLLRVLSGKRHASSLVVAATFDRKVITTRARQAKGIDLFMSKSAPPANIAIAMTALITGPAARRGRIVVLPSALRQREPEELAFLLS
jgi:DNA-binding NarL/FixJ family response regulator